MVVLLSLVVALFGLCAACTCEPQNNDPRTRALETLAAAQHVVVARVLESAYYAEDDREFQNATVVVTESFQGSFDVGDKISVHTETTCCLCGFALDDDTSYLLTPFGAQTPVSSCGATCQVGWTACDNTIASLQSLRQPNNLTKKKSKKLSAAQQPLVGGVAVVLIVLWIVLFYLTRKRQYTTIPKPIELEETGVDDDKLLTKV